MELDGTGILDLLLFLGNPLRESGRIVYRWKGLDEEIAAPLESKETAQ